MIRAGRLGWGVQNSNPWWTLGGTISGWVGTGSPPSNVCVGAYEAKGTSDLASAKLNIANPEKYNLSGVDPNFSALLGFIFNGTTHVLDTGIVPIVGYSIIIFISSITEDSEVMDIPACGQETSGSRTVILPKFSYDMCGFKIGSSGIGIGSSISSGSMSISGGFTYVNGINTGQPEQAVGTPSLPLAIGASKKSSGYNYGECSIAFLAIYSFVLSSEQNLALHLKMSSL